MNYYSFDKVAKLATITGRKKKIKPWCKTNKCSIKSSNIKTLIRYNNKLNRKNPNLARVACYSKALSLFGVILYDFDLSLKYVECSSLSKNIE